MIKVPDLKSIKLPSGEVEKPCDFILTAHAVISFCFFGYEETLSRKCMEALVSE